jgi:hypothetical protein
LGVASGTIQFAAVWFFSGVWRMLLMLSVVGLLIKNDKGTKYQWRWDLEVLHRDSKFGNIPSETISYCFEILR